MIFNSRQTGISLFVCNYPIHLAYINYFLLLLKAFYISKSVKI